MSQLPSLTMASTDERMTDRYTSQPSADTLKLQLHRRVVCHEAQKFLSQLNISSGVTRLGVAKFLSARDDSSNWPSLAETIVCLFVCNTCTVLERP